LDKATKAQLDRGMRTVEVLKQPQYAPAPVEQQVMIIYAVTNGYLDDVAVGAIREWEADFHKFMSEQYANVGQAIRKEKVLSKETEAALRQGIEAFKGMGNREKGMGRGAGK
jgi:F-type H+-transporting ATPase subunit alpha